MGAEHRCDDDAGLLVARVLRAPAPAGVEVHESAGDAGGLVGAAAASAQGLAGV